MSVTIIDVTGTTAWETNSSKIETTIFGTTRFHLVALVAHQLTATRRTTNVILFSEEVNATLRLRALIDEGNLLDLRDDML